jgi:peptidoglycan/xylan/chitin deacetylase (PgdA/CDA1 family)
MTFDDGFQNAADIGVPILSKYGFPVSFYVVTGWVAPVRAAITDPVNIGCSHGTWAYWRQVSKLGHEVGSHSFSHLNARGKKAALMPWLVIREISRSIRDLQQEVPHSSYTISMPWNAASRVSDLFVRRRFSACRLGSSVVEYNHFSRLNRYRLRSWAPGSQHSWSDYVQAIDGVPEDGWLILQFHSFGDEGWEPVTPEFFNRICELIAERHMKVETVRDAIERLGTKSRLAVN